MSSFAYGRIISDWFKKDHIVKFVDFLEDQALLIMEYLPLGNLWVQDKKHRITEEDAVFLLYQGLIVLKHLHEQGVMHQDITPGNILVQSREPFIIKLADFGLAKEGAIMQTCCGTYAYTAKEVFSGEPYKHEVDVWSLGVVTMEFVYGLPEPRPRQVTDEWRKEIIRRATDWGDEGSEDPLMAVLARKMLKLDFEDRATAEECLTFGRKGDKKNGIKGIFAMAIPQTHNNTPTARETGQAGSARGIGSASISTEVPTCLPKDDDLSSGFYHIASEVTEIAQITDYDFQHVQIEIEGQFVLMRKADSFLNATHIMNIAGKSNVQRERLLIIIKKHMSVKIILRGCRISGSWINLSTGRILCEYLSLKQKLRPLLDYGSKVDEGDDDYPVGLKNGLRAYKPRKKDGVQPIVKKVPREERSDYVEVQESVRIRRWDLRVNGTHILNVAGQVRQEMVKTKKKLRSDQFDIVVCGDVKIQGTYVDLNVGIDLCRQYNLTELEDRLQTWKPAEKGPTLTSSNRPVDSVPSPRPVSIRSQVSTEGRQAELKETRDRAQHWTSSQKLDSVDDQIREDDTDSASDTAGSESSVRLHEIALIQNTQSRVHEPSSIHQGMGSTKSRYSSNADCSLCDTSNCEHLRMSNLEYEIWNSQSEHSHLTEVKPDLRPHSWETASKYASSMDYSTEYPFLEDKQK